MFAQFRTIFQFLYCFRFSKGAFARDRDDVNSGPSRFGHSIIYNRCLHKTGMENAETSLKSPACWTELTVFRPGGIQSGMYVNPNTFQTGLSCPLRFVTTHARQSPVKTTMAGKGNKSKRICDFHIRLMSTCMLTISIFISV